MSLWACGSGNVYLELALVEEALVESLVEALVEMGEWKAALEALLFLAPKRSGGATLRALARRPLMQAARAHTRRPLFAAHD